MKASALLYAVAATAAGLGIQMCDGEYRPTGAGTAAIVLITVAIVATAVAVAQPSRVTAADIPARYWTALFAALLGAPFAILLLGRPDSSDRPYLLVKIEAFRPGYVVALLVGVVAAGTTLAAGRRPRILRLCVVMLLAAFTGAAVICLKATHRPQDDTSPHIDVFVFQQQGARALLRGENPYQTRNYPDIYQSGTIDLATGARRQDVYGPGMSDGQTLHFGFPYFPASLYLTTLGYAAAGDYRYTQVVALVLAAVLIFGRGQNSIAAMAAALLLFTPRVFFVLISGWTEPLLVLWMAAVVFCATRRSRWLPVALGMLLATKQYMLLALPATWLLIPQGEAGAVRRWVGLLVLSGGIALLVTLPLAAWDFHRFYYSTFTVQRFAPFRWDALSYLTWHSFGHGPPTERARVVWPFVMTILAMALCLWRGPRSPAGFAGATSLILLVFIAFNKQAFANYYFFVIGALCVAASVATPRQFGAVNGPAPHR